jgi:hypothetical protein
LFSAKKTRGVEGESDEVKAMSTMLNKDLRNQSQQMMKSIVANMLINLSLEQDEQLGELHGVIQNIKYAGNDFSLRTALADRQPLAETLKILGLLENRWMGSRNM